MDGITDLMEMLVLEGLLGRCKLAGTCHMVGGTSPGRSPTVYTSLQSVPLQCSCLENPRDGGAWWAAVCGVAQSQTPSPTQFLHQNRLVEGERGLAVGWPQEIAVKYKKCSVLEMA